MGSLGARLLLLVLGPALVALTVNPSTAVAATPFSIGVTANHLVDGNGTAIRLLGVNRSGTEYACIQGWGIFDGPNDAASVAAMAAWHINVVRIPLNEDCWLNINGVNAAYAGATYQSAIQTYVNLLHQRGLYAILELHWNAPGTSRATGATQAIMVGGLAWSNDLSGWLVNKPSDPANALVASFHNYNFNVCKLSCWNSTVATLAAQVPLVTGEIGENDCAHGYIDQYMSWADAHGISYLGWTWDTWDCSNGPALISDYNGTPTAFG